MVRVEPLRLEWAEALTAGDDVFTERFEIPVVDGWCDFPEAFPRALEGARRHSADPWGTHLFFDDDGALVGWGGWKGAPVDGGAELGYAIAPPRRGHGVATNVVQQMIEQARAASLAMVCAHTLPEENASNAVLRKCGFAMVGAIDDPDEGTFWRWERALDG